MDSTFSRLNIIICSFIISLACCAFGNFLSSFIYTETFSSNVTLNSVLDLGISPYLRNDHANVALNISSDLSKIPQWNTNQLFLFIFVSYNNNSKRNFVTIWDNIVSVNNNNMIYSMDGVINKYPIRDIGNSLRGRKFEINIAYCYMPIVGRIHYRYQYGEKSYFLPKKYFRYS
ncbi:hypothetical protein FG386_003247 [Cryptosporidium ryanae]|uniref:uncharacterized protein n=1 Tax=Cryptosporidium ryanae TaxID=515981 RepID=UPI003519ED95|nr:hypothetical protein FG386_003247 [Cryptosporidium ryanae]